MAEHQTVHLQESNSDPSILENDGGHVRAKSDPIQDRDASIVTNAVMVLTSSSNSSGAFQVARDQFASCDSSTIESSRLDCVVSHFCYGQAIESKGAAEH